MIFERPHLTPTKGKQDINPVSVTLVNPICHPAIDTRNDNMSGICICNLILGVH